VRDPREICSADKAARVIVFHVREGFGDGKTAGGLKLADTAAELVEAKRIFSEAIDVILEKMPSAVPVERWVRL
jgi:hypothetical protein